MDSIQVLAFVYQILGAKNCHRPLGWIPGASLLSAVIDTLHLEDLFLVPGISILAVILPANLHAGESVYLFV